jgi:adenine phosphoribosyltransferase
VAGIEARGFILGGAVAHQLSVGFVPVRKKGKLPWKVIGEDYALEYGVDRVEIHEDAVAKGEHVIVVGRRDEACAKAKDFGRATHTINNKKERREIDLAQIYEVANQLTKKPKRITRAEY